MEIDNLICNLCKIRKAIKAVEKCIKKLLIEQGARDVEQKIRDEIRELERARCQVGKQERNIENQISKKEKQIKILKEKTKQRMACVNTCC